MAVVQRKLCSKGHAKDGITLMELVISMGLIGILLASEVSVLSKVYIQYRKHVKYSNESMYVNEAFRIIEYELDNDCKNIDIINNSIKIDTGNENKSVIHFVRAGDSGNIVITYYSPFGVKTSNYLIKSVKDFKAYSKGKNLYLSIYTDNEREFNKCIALERKP